MSVAATDFWCQLHGPYEGPRDAGDDTTCPLCFVVANEGHDAKHPVQRSCICCDCNLGVGWYFEPNGGVLFTSTGNYGSGIEDRMGGDPKGDWEIVLYVCDTCMYRKQQSILEHRKKSFGEARRYEPPEDGRRLKELRFQAFRGEDGKWSYQVRGDGQMDAAGTAPTFPQLLKDAYDHHLKRGKHRPLTPEESDRLFADAIRDHVEKPSANETWGPEEGE